MFILVRMAVTFVAVLLIIYLINMLPMRRRAKEILRTIVIVLGVLSLLGIILNL